MRLRVLGGLSIESATGEVLRGAAARRRPLALLAIVAAHGGRGVSRERLCSLLWPESDEGRARNVLNQTVSSLRRELRQQELFLGVADLRLNPSAISSDLVDFRAALEAGELARAAELHTGPFLDGIHLTRGAAEFERWVDGARASLDHQLAQTLRALATSAEGDGRLEVAAEWWRRLAALEPGDLGAACGLMSVLEALGDRSGALRHAQLYELYLRHELDVEPDPVVGEFVARLRASRALLGSAPRATSSEEASQSVTSSAADARARAATTMRATAAAPTAREDVGTAIVDSGVDLARRQPPPARLPRSRRGVLAAGFLALVISSIAAVAWIVASSTPAGPAEALDRNAVVVFPFIVSGTGGAAYLSEALPHLLSANLDGAGEIRALDPRVVMARIPPKSDSVDAAQGAVIARQLGAGRFVIGAVVQAGGRVRISSSLHDQRDPDVPLGRTTVEGSLSDLFALADSASERLLALYPAGSQPRFSSAAGSTTASLAAFRAYLGGESAFRRGDFSGAIELLQRAVKADSSFALARYRLSIAADWGARYDLAHAAAERAAQDSLRLTPYYRLLLGSLRAQRNSDADEAERLVRRALSIQREDSEAWYQLAEILMHMNAMRGRSLREAREPFKEVLARSPDHFESLIHLARLAAYEGDRKSLRELLPMVRRAAPPALAFETELLAAFALDDRRKQDRLLVLAAGLGDVDLHNQCARVAVYGRGHGGVERLCGLLIEPTRSIEGRAVGYWGLAELAMWRGQRRQARKYLEELKALVPEWGLALEALYAAYPPTTAASTELRTLGQRLEGHRTEPPPRSLRYFGVMDGMHPMLRAYLRGYLSVHAGDTSAARPAIRELTAASKVASPSGLLARNFAAALRAQQFALEGRPDRALQELEQQGGEYMVSERWIGELHSSRFLRAEVLELAGRDREAIGWYGTFGQASIWELGLEAPAAMASARIAERLGRAEVAAENYRRVVELWEGADAELLPVVAEARRRLKAVGM